MLNNRRAEDRFSPVEDVTDSIARKLGELDRGNDRTASTAKTAKTRFIGVRLTATKTTPAPIEAATPDLNKVSGPKALARVVIVDGPGQGQSFFVKDSFTRIGREQDQEIQLAFGDNAISRDGHATIVHYGEGSDFVIRDGMRVNPVLVNNRTIRGDKTLGTGDIIRIGATTLRFEAFQ
jgi:hypothetical protein